MNSNQFHNIYSDQYETIYRFIYRLMGNRENSRDICQDTFTKLYVALSDGKTIDNPKAWLYKVAANHCKSILTRGNHFEKIQQEMQFDHDQSSLESPEDEIIRLDLMLRIKKVIAGLSPTEQILIQLYSEGISYKEMAESTGIALNSVGNSLWRAIRKCSQELKEVS